MPAATEFGTHALNEALQRLRAPAKTRATERRRREAAGTVLAVAHVSPASVVRRIDTLTAALRAIRDEETTTARESDEERASLVVDTRRVLARAIAAVAGVKPSPPVAEAVAAVLSDEDPEIVGIGTTAAERFVTGLDEQEGRLVRLRLGMIADALAALIERVADGKLSIGYTDLNRAGSVLGVVVKVVPDLSEPLVPRMVRATFEATSDPISPPPLSVLESIATAHPAAIAANPNSVKELLERVAQLDFEDWSSISGSAGPIAEVMRVVRAAPMAATDHVDVILEAIASLDGAEVHEPAFETLREIVDEDPGAVHSAAADNPESLYAFTRAADRFETTILREHIEDRAQLLPVPDVTDDGTPDGVTFAGLETLTRLVRHDPEAFSKDAMWSVRSLGWNALITHSNVRIVTEALRLLIWIAKGDPEVLISGLERTLETIGPDPGDWVEDRKRYGPTVARLALTLYEELADAGALEPSHSAAVAAARERADDLDPIDSDLLDDISDGPTRLVDVIDPETDTDVSDNVTGIDGITVDDVSMEGYTRHPPALTERIELLGSDLVRHAIWVPQPQVQSLVEASHQGRTASARWQLRAFATTARQDPSAVSPDLDRILVAAGRLDDPEIVADALAVALEVANDDPGTVAPHVATIADLAEGHGDDATIAAAGVIAEVGRYEPAAATASVETLLAAVGPLADGVELLLGGFQPEEEDPHPRYAAELLEVVADIAVERPEAVVDDLETAVEAGTALFPVVFGPTRSPLAELSAAEERAEEAFRRALLATMSTIRSVGLEHPTVADRGLERLFAVDDEFKEAFDRIKGDMRGRWAAEYSLLLSELTALTRRPELASQCLAELAPVIENWCVRFGDEEADVSAAVAHVEAACVAVLDRFDDPEVVLAALDRLDELSASFPDRFPEETILNAFHEHTDLAVRRRAIELLNRYPHFSGDDDGTVERFAAGVADATDPGVLLRGMDVLASAASMDSQAVKAAGTVGAAIAGSERPLATLEVWAWALTEGGESRKEAAFNVELLAGYYSATGDAPRSVVTLVDESLATVLDGDESAQTTAVAADLLGRTGSVLADGPPEPPTEFVEQYFG